MSFLGEWSPRLPDLNSTNHILYVAEREVQNLDIMTANLEECYNRDPIFEKCFRIIVESYQEMKRFLRQEGVQLRNAKLYLIN